MNRFQFFAAMLVLPSYLVAGPVVWNFDDCVTDQLPVKWKVEQSVKATSSALWKVVVDTTAPSASKVLSLYTASPDNSLYNLCWTDSLKFENVQIEVSFKTMSGENQNGGVCWRVKDKDNYLAMRANAAEGNIRNYRVVNGIRSEIGSLNMGVTMRTWHTLKIVQQGAETTCWIDGVQKLKNTDNTIKGAGGVGCWTKGINRVNFDNFKVTNLDASSIRQSERVNLIPVNTQSAPRANIMLNGREIAKPSRSFPHSAGILINPETGKKCVRQW